MAIKRQGRFYSQQRLATPALRDLEQSVAADFDSVLRDMVAGTSLGFVLKGFKVNIGASTFSQSADNLTLNTLNGALLNTQAIEAGTLLKVTGSSAEALNTSNARVSGSFIAGSTNYISVNYVRKAATSTDTVYFYDKNSETEFSKSLPVSTFLDYQIVINTTGFGINVPIAIITTSAGNVPTQITDSRNMLFRLGSGGITPDQFYDFAWTGGRTEPGTVTTSNDDIFSGADKDIGVFKDWMDAVMSSIKEIKGTSYWFSTSGGGGSPTGLSLQTVNDDANMSTWHGSGTLYHNISTTGQLVSSATFTIQNMVTDAAFVVEPFTKALAVGEVLFLDLNRFVDVSGNVTIAPAGVLPGALVGQNNLVIQASSVGQLTSLTSGTPYGDWVKSKNDNERYFRKIEGFYDSAGSLTNSVNATYLLLDSSYNITGASTGIQQIHYNQGYYGSAQVLTGSRVSILNTYDAQNVYWLAYRSDQGLHIRNRGRMVAGETRPIDENTSNNVLDFIGASNESLTFPVYATDVVGGITSPSQVNYSGTTTDNLTVRVSELSSAMANKAQDRNIAMVGGGDNVSNLGGTLSWNASITFIINGPGAGTTNYISPGNLTLSNNQCAYVTIDRNSVAALVPTVVDFDDVPLAENTLVIARKLDSDALWVGIDGLAYQISSGFNSTVGVTPASIASFGVANTHKWTQEIPVGAIDSSNTSFTLAKAPYSSTSTLIFKNGMFQSLGSDFSLTNNVNIEFAVAPTTGDEVVAVYGRGSVIPYTYVQSITTVSVTTNVISLTPSPQCSYTPGIAVFVNGLQRVVETDFRATATSVSFSYDLNPGSVVSCFYTGVNDNEIAEQGAISPALSNTRTTYSYLSDINHPNLALFSIDGVSMFPVNNPVSGASITINDYVFLYGTQYISINNFSVTFGSIGYMWAR